MKKFIITESEKERILEMHRNAIKRQYLKEAEEPEVGTITAQEREQYLVDGGMNYIGFNIVGNQNTYYYNCTAEFGSTPEQQVGAEKAGAIHMGEKVFTAAELGMKGNYQDKLRQACGNIYTWIAEKRKTFCADPKNKTKPNYGWNCPQPAPAPQVAAATNVDTKAAEQKAKEDADRAKRDAATTAEISKAQEFSTKMAEYRTKLDGYNDMAQDQLETLINEINAYWKNSLLYRGDNDVSTYRRLFPKFNTAFKTKFPTITILLDTK